MNGVAFANLPQLAVVNLAGNVCVNKDIEIRGDSNIFLRRIERNCASTNASARTISCDPTSDCNVRLDPRFVEKNKDVSGCCEIEEGAHIHTPDYSIAAERRYTNFEVITIIHQRNVEFLPVSVYETFPNLKFYFVFNAPIQKITKKNFEKMFKLVELKLSNNQIEMIRSDTFEDLTSLRELAISMYNLG